MKRVKIAKLRKTAEMERCAPTSLPLTHTHTYTHRLPPLN